MFEEKNQITEFNRRNIVDRLILEKVNWCGRLDETAFLGRVFDLESMHSTDSRFRGAAADIFQHRVRNNDWEDDWVFHDSRFNLLNGSDEDFLNFLCETIHPIVRNDLEECAKLKSLYNEYLKHDGFEIHEVSQISGHPIYGARKIVGLNNGGITAVKETLKHKVDANYIAQQITRMELAVTNDPDLAIGTAKELIESCCKTILADRNVDIDKNWDLPQLAKATMKELKLTASDIPEEAASADIIKKLLNNLSTVAVGIAELRNKFGTGHGKQANAKGLTPRHAKLAVGASSTLVVFLFETHEDRKS